MINFLLLALYRLKLSVGPHGGLGLLNVLFLASLKQITEDANSPQSLVVYEGPNIKVSAKRGHKSCAHHDPKVVRLALEKNEK